MNLEEHLDIQTGPPHLEESFRVRDESTAGWALRKLAKLRTQIDANDLQARDYLQKVHGWLTDVNKPLHGDVDYFEFLLADWINHLRLQDPACKSVKLPDGVIATRTTAGKVEIEDEDEFIAWAQEQCPQLVRVSTEISRAELNKLPRHGQELVTDDGVPVPGVTIGPPTVSVTVKTT